MALFHQQTTKSSLCPPFSNFLASSHHSTTDLIVDIISSPLLSPMICASLGLLPAFASLGCYLMGLQAPFFSFFAPACFLFRVVVPWILCPVGCHSPGAAAGKLVKGKQRVGHPAHQTLAHHKATLAGKYPSFTSAMEPFLVCTPNSVLSLLCESSWGSSFPSRDLGLNHLNPASVIGGLWPQHSTRVLADTATRSFYLLITAFLWVLIGESPSWRLTRTTLFISIRGHWFIRGCKKLQSFLL